MPDDFGTPVSKNVHPAFELAGVTQRLKHDLCVESPRGALLLDVRLPI